MQTQTLRPLTTHEAKVIAFMAARDYTRGHADRLHAVEAIWDETVAEARSSASRSDAAGPNGMFDESVTMRLRMLAADREDVIIRAVERYEDWASD